MRQDAKSVVHTAPPRRLPHRHWRHRRHWRRRYFLPYMASGQVRGTHNQRLAVCSVSCSIFNTEQRARDTNNAAAALTSARQEIFRLQLLTVQHQYNASRHSQPNTSISDIQAVHHLDAVLLFKVHNNTSEKGARVHTIPLSRLTTMPGTHPISLMQLVQSGIKSVTLR